MENAQKNLPGSNSSFRLHPCRLDLSATQHYFLLIPDVRSEIKTLFRDRESNAERPTGIAPASPCFLARTLRLLSASGNAYYITIGLAMRRREQAELLGSRREILTFRILPSIAVCTIRTLSILYHIVLNIVLREFLPPFSFKSDLLASVRVSLQFSRKPS